MEQQKYRSWVEVDLDSFSRNWEELKRLVGPDVRIMQVVKADAYGHGALELSSVALRNGAWALGVANADEGVQLRASGIAAPIVILSPSPDSEIGQIVKYGLTPSVSDASFARELQKSARKAGVRVPVHIEVDTGMGRGGTIHYEAFDLIRAVLDMPNLDLEGIFTHLSSSEVLVDYNNRQWTHFRNLLAKLDENRIRIPLRHMSNSGAVLNFPEYNLDLVRPGIMTYGIYPGPETRDRADLAPVMSFKTRVVLLKEFPEGYSIGYNRTYITYRPTRIATIPVGYGDGYGILLSNSGEVLIRGRKAPIVGRISMDMCTIDVSHIPDCAIGDEVVLMGRQGDGCISANEIAARTNTISYDVLCALGKRAPRIFVQKGRADAVEPRLRRIYIPGEEKSVARIDSIIRHCFQTRARSEEMGDAIFSEMFETLFGKEDRQLELRDRFRYDIEISEASPQNGKRKKGEYFRVLTRVEYTKALREPVFMIGCAMTNAQLEALFEEKRCEYRWLLNLGDEAVTERDFRVERVTIDGEDIPILRSENTERGYEVWCGGDLLKKKLNRPVRFAFEIATKKSKENNLFSVYVVYPTRGLEISFKYEKANLRRVREVSYFAGKHPYPRVAREQGRCTTLTIADDEWIFPNSGVTFIWDT
ncbi:MAG TPA: alanine racemase [Syntrophales bacterium]|nr:alanine racemase [Syntrophales bacterium]